MPTVAKDNSVFAQIDIFPVEPEQQQSLVDSLVDYVETVLKQQPGFVSASIHQSRDGLRVVNYIQWSSQDDYDTYINSGEVRSLSTSLSTFALPNSHLYEIFISEPEGSQIKISEDMEGLINFGIFKLKNPENQPRLIELATEAVGMVAGQTGLISTQFHRSLDCAMAVNYGLWRTQAEYAAMNDNRPFAGPLTEMFELADNEYQLSLYEVVFTEPAD